MVDFNTLKRNLINIPGWFTKQKIIVFESDDWGTIRTRSKEDVAYFKKEGLAVDKCHYMLNDSLASEKDLSELFKVLMSHKDSLGNHPIFTANALVANPEFQKIKESDYSKYYFESFKTTLSKYPEHANAFNLWKKGMDEKVFHPQSHGREHVNISRWLHDLQQGNAETLLAFGRDTFGVSGHIVKQKRGSYLAAFDGGEMESKFDETKIVREALQLFEQEFGYKSKSFIAPNYVWNDAVEAALEKEGVTYIQGTNTQRFSKDVNAKLIVKRHYLGQKNKYNQKYLIRNCIFEPSGNLNKDWVNDCLKQIEISFRWHKPAIIATHRVNYIGFINPKNRDRNLPQLQELLTQIIKKWPEVIFLTSDQLGNLMQKDGK